MLRLLKTVSPRIKVVTQKKEEEKYSFTPDSILVKYGAKLIAKLADAGGQGRRWVASLRGYLCQHSNKKKSGRDTFLSELIWREFYYHILNRWPKVEESACLEQYNNLNWSIRPRCLVSEPFFTETRCHQMWLDCFLMKKQLRQPVC